MIFSEFLLTFVGEMAKIILYMSNEADIIARTIAPNNGAEPMAGNEINALMGGLRPVFEGERPIIIAGPCSAESREQVLRTALALKDAGVTAFRAGVWKPRTHPGGFEGHGSEALKWLQEAREASGLPLATEVASSAHLREALDAGVDILWLGARTTTNPFAVQDIAEAALQWAHEHNRDISDLKFLVKNPANPDLELWIGAIQRLYNVGIRRITAIHRGFSVYGNDIYRNPPQWQIPMELRRRLGSGLQMLCDPSHIGGKREMVENISLQAIERGFDGLIIETHPDPDNALSDSLQQITPEALKAMLLRLDWQRDQVNDSVLTSLRECIDNIDDRLMELLRERMEVAREIGHFKRTNSMSVVQPERYNSLIAKRVSEGESKGMSATFVRQLLALIHEESVRQQLQ